MHRQPGSRRRLHRMSLYQYFLLWYDLKGTPHHKCWLNELRTIAAIEQRDSRLFVTLDDGQKLVLADDFEIEVEVY